MSIYIVEEPAEKPVAEVAIETVETAVVKEIKEEASKEEAMVDVEETEESGVETPTISIPVSRL